jgi:hypothetical protein
MRVAILSSILVSVAAAQPVLCFDHVESTQGRGDFAQAIREVLDKEASLDEVSVGLVIHGSELPVAVGEWLFHELDGGAFAVFGSNAGMVSIFRPSPVAAARPPRESGRSAPWRTSKTSCGGEIAKHYPMEIAKHYPMKEVSSFV